MSARENSDGSPFTSGLDLDRRSTSDALQHAVVAPLRALSFWTAVLLPLAYLPLLAGGLGGGETSVLLGLVVANVAALYLGHDHAR